MTGVYFLINRLKVVYVGATTNYRVRIKQHKDKIWDTSRIIECKEEKLSEYERRLIMKFKPKYNIQKGREGKTRKAHVEPSEKVILVGFYTKQRYVDQVGGMAEARKRAKNAIEC